MTTYQARCQRISANAISGLTCIEHFDLPSYIDMELGTVPRPEQIPFLLALVKSCIYAHASALGSQRLIAELLRDPERSTPTETHKGHDERNTMTDTTAEASQPVTTEGLLELIYASLDQLKTLIENPDAPADPESETDLQAIASRIFGA